MAKPLVDKLPTKSNKSDQELHMLFCPATITLSNRTLDYPARLIRRHRVSIGSRWCRFTTGRQALLVLTHLCNGDTYQRLASGSGIGLAIVHRYIREVVALLSTLAPSLEQAVARLSGSFSNHALLDGIVIRIDRVRHHKPYYCVKT